MQDTPQQVADRLRSTHRARRTKLTPETLKANALALADRVKALPSFSASQHIAAYIAIRGEIDLDPLMRVASDAGKSVYLPVLRGSEMQFWPYTPGAELNKREMGLLEPDTNIGAAFEPERLDLVLAPLVVFDDHCQRIGQGGGYYDRCFAFRRDNPNHSPHLLGVAHDSQREPRLQAMPWDIPLDMIATERALYTAPETFA